MDDASGLGKRKSISEMKRTDLHNIDEGTNQHYGWFTWMQTVMHPTVNDRHQMADLRHREEIVMHRTKSRMPGDEEEAFGQEYEVKKEEDLKKDIVDVRDRKESALSGMIMTWHSPHPDQ